MKLLKAIHFGFITSLVITFLGAWTTSASAQVIVPPAPKDPDTREVFRVTKIEWNLQQHKLHFTIAVGECQTALSKEGTCKDELVDLKKLIDYSIDPDNALMWTNDETRKFSLDEAVKVLHPLLDYLGRYAGESHLWWQEGHGERIDRTAKFPMRNPPGITFEGLKTGTRTLRR